MSDKLQSLSTKAPSSLQPYFLNFARFFDEKKWQQLVLLLTEFSMVPEAQPFLLPLFQSFLIIFEAKVDPAAYIAFISRVAATYNDPNAAVSFLGSLHDKSFLSTPNKSLLDLKIANYLLQCGKLEETKAIVSKYTPTIERDSDIDNDLRIEYHLVCSNLAKIEMNFTGYYQSTLLYLGCTNLATLSAKEQIERSHALIISALLSKTLYSFTSLVGHPVLECLRESPHWGLVDLLKIFQQGKVEDFKNSKNMIQAYPDLEASYEFLHEKICLSALVELFFRKNGKTSVIHFNEISAATQVTVDKVEFLILKAMSFNLVRGIIDQVDQSFQVTWIVPRLIDVNQTQMLLCGLAEWRMKLETTLLDVKSIFVGK